MRVTFHVGDEAHAWFGAGGGVIVPKLVTITKITTTQITARDADGQTYRFRVRDYRRVGGSSGGPELKPIDHDAAARQLAARSIEMARRSIFAGAGKLISLDHWSNNPEVMAQIADEWAVFLERIQAIGIALPTIQREWLEQREALSAATER